MYIPRNLTMDGDGVVADFIAAYGFGIMVSSDLVATHLPLQYAPSKGELGTLYGHFARANPHWKALDSAKVLIIFNGPHAYISPRWYANKPAVPTWNYAAVHCTGTLSLLDDDSNHDAMSALIKQYEPELLDDADIMPADYRDKLSKAVVGFSVALDSIQGKEKLGQHRKPEDQKGVFAALQQSNHLDAKALAAYMQQRQIGIGL
ncbi:FMN-binding negative transcriptional regulator [Aestuariibacter halophilus]|uniref:FMN-binding negative transcriptional regulator n=1 Tax=Fluctibacter halophilus TaxID=226011 RepID=A0ABS8GA43_9ALTE|nr:FMN-binding negative transcriptional regulator [Aestuariibacter halophilus]MCC2616096.1 FMN-binding negative transcriptional regulator [Aestuariibacter halophilus]